MPRLAVITPYFPTSANPQGGRSSYETLKQLRRYAEIQAFCPIATYPSADWLKPRSYLYRRPDVHYSPPFIPARYIEYPVLPVLSRPINGFVSASRIRDQVLQYRPDLILNYWLYPEGFAAVSLARRLGIPSIVCAIGSDIRRIPDSITKRLTVRTLRQATAVLTVSRELRDRVIALGIPELKVHPVLNGCDFSVFQPMDRDAARAALGVDPQAELIVYAGSLIPTKGLRELKQAFLQLRERRPRLQLVMLGAGSLRPDLEGHGILLPGICDAATVARWMNAANVFTLPSYSEGCPNVVIEALSCGCPVVATSVGGIPEVLDGRGGILVPPANTSKLATALEEALVRRWDSEAISRSFRRGWAEVADETWQVCRSVLKS